MLKKYLKNFEESGFSFEEINLLSDKDIKNIFVKEKEKEPSIKSGTLFSFFPSLSKKLKRKGVKRALLWEEHKQKHPDGLGIS